MRTCPVCRTAIFDDMDTCYGCMYRFEAEQAAGSGDERSGADTADGDAAETSGAARGVAGGSGDGDGLSRHFLIELERFLRGFLLDSGVKIE